MVVLGFLERLVRIILLLLIFVAELARVSLCFEVSLRELMY